MFLITIFTLIYISSSLSDSQVSAPKSYFKCYSCTQTTCDHDYCDVIETSIETFGLKWKNVPTCIKDGPNDTIDKSLVQQCNDNEICGKVEFEYAITAIQSVSLGNVPAESIPVLVSNSTIATVYGCMPKNHSICPTSTSQQKQPMNYRVPDPKIPGQENLVTVTNKNLECCLCDKVVCNTFYEEYNCNRAINSNTNGVGNSNKRLNIIGKIMMIFTITTTALYMFH